MREGAFKIFATTPRIIEKQHETTVQEAFVKGFKDDSVEVFGTVLPGAHGKGAIFLMCR